MTVDAARRTRRRSPARTVSPEPIMAPPAPHASIAIGEIDQTIFECPSCSRPLALGAGRCPGCRTRLVRGVTLGKASGFVAFGLAVGLLAGAGGAVVFGLSRVSVAPAALPGAGPASGGNGGGHGGGGPTSTAPAATPAAPTATAATTIPPVAGSALTQAIDANGRLAAYRAELRSALGAKAFDSSAVAQVLRAISAESLFDQQVATRVGGWSGSREVGAQLETFYGSVHDAAANGLIASVRNQGAYRSAAASMVKLLDELPGLDAAMRSVAASAGFEFPPGAGSTAP